MDIKLVKANDKEIEYFSFGRGEKSFVIIPGVAVKSVMLSADAIKSAYSQLGDEYTVYVFDRARALSNGYTVEDMADDTAMAMKELGIENAYVFGASQGGMIAMLIAIKHPNLIKKMVLGSTASRLCDESLSLLNEWVSLAENGDVVGLNHSVFTSLYSPELLASLGDTLVNMEKDGTPQELERFAVQAGACTCFDIYDRLNAISCDTLVIGARNDRVLGAAASVELADKLKCELYMYDGGHAVYDEALDYKDRIQDFFNK